MAISLTWNGLSAASQRVTSRLGVEHNKIPSLHNTRLHSPKKARMSLRCSIVSKETNSGSSVISDGNVGSYPTNTIPPGAWTLSGGSVVVASAQNQTDLATAIAYYQAMGP